MIKSLSEIWRVLDSHVAIALVVGLGLFAYFGWHRPLPTPGSINQPILNVQPGQPPQIIFVPVPGLNDKVSETVTAPTASERVIVVEKPIVVSATEETKIVKDSPETVSIRISRICIHGSVDPDCGSPLYPEITAVRSVYGF